MEVDLIKCFEELNASIDMIQGQFGVDCHALFKLRACAIASRIRFVKLRVVFAWILEEVAKANLHLSPRNLERQANDMEQMDKEE